MYHVTAKGQGLSWELKVAVLQEIEERLIAPPPPAARRRHTRHKRKGTASAQHAVPSTREENSPISLPNREKRCDTALQFQAQERKIHHYRRTIGLDAAWHASLATTSHKKLNSAYKSNRYFNFVVDTFWRADAPVLTKQLLEMYSEKQVEEGHKPTCGHSH